MRTHKHTKGNEQYVGLDVHQDSISVAVADGGRNGEARSLGAISSDLHAVEKLLSRLRREHGPDATLSFCYEAGPSGFGLARTVKLLWDERARVKTITADNGTEFHNYKDLEAILETDVYFATPHHAWERGTNENTNGLIRQYLPKGKNLSTVTQEQCNRIAETLNNRPRKRHGFRTPNELYLLSPSVALQS